MIRTNLATRPFYNVRAVRAWLGVLALVAAGATLFNVSRLLSYSRSDTELQVRATEDEARAAALQRAATRLRASVDPGQVSSASVDAQAANELIDRRTFSWTELFNRFESTLPGDVRITSVRPRIDRDRYITLTVTILARSVEDVSQFMENLQETRAFGELLSREEHMNDAGQLEAVLEARYVPGPVSEKGKGR